MNVLILKNASVEGPGTIEDHLCTAGAAFNIIDLERGESLPEPEPFSHLVVMGGPMAVYEMDRTPYLRDEGRLIERFLRTGRPVLGVCLGSQLLAQVLGARVYPGGTQEIGWSEVALTKEGMQDRCMRTLAVEGTGSAEVFQWHGDTFDLPAGAVRLASSSFYPNQAFRHGDNIYALQFHIEVTPAIVREWFGHEHQIDIQAVNAASERIYPAYLRRALNLYGEFFRN